MSITLDDHEFFLIDCPDCGGDRCGATPGSTCTVCAGRGQVQGCTVCGDEDGEDGEREGCDHCDGTGCEDPDVRAAA